MAISSAQVMQPQRNQGGDALMQLSQMLAQQSQFKQSQAQNDEQFKLAQGQKDTQFAETNRLKIEEQLKKDKDAKLKDEATFIQKGAQDNFDLYMSLPKETVYGNERVLGQFIKDGITLGRFNEDTTFDEISAVLDSTQKEVLDAEGLEIKQSAEARQAERLAFDKWKWQQEFDRDSLSMNVSEDAKMHLATIGKIQRDLLGMTAKERASYITDNRLEGVFENFNKQVAIPNGWAPISVQIENKGDWKFWTPKYEGSVTIGGEDQKNILTYSQETIDDLKAAAKSGDKGAIADLLKAGIDGEAIHEEGKSEQMDLMDQVIKDSFNVNPNFNTYNRQQLKVPQTGYSQVNR